MARKVKWTPAAVRGLLRRVEPRFATHHLFELRELLTKQLVRDYFVTWGNDVATIARKLHVDERFVYQTIQDVARKARV